MNNVQTVFDFIKNKCINNDSEHNDCYRELNNMLTANLGERPTLAYVRELSCAGLIKFNEFSRSVSLTRKGRITHTLSEVSLAA